QVFWLEALLNPSHPVWRDSGKSSTILLFLSLPLEGGLEGLLMIKNYLKTAWRTIWKNRTTSFINIAGLSVGMTASVLILLWVQNETSFDNYHKDAGNIYRLTTRLPEQGWVWESTPLLLADAVKNEVPEIVNTARLSTNNWPVFNIKGSLFYGKECAYVDNGWFSMFNYTFKEGNANSFYENPFSVILTASEATKYFGNNTAVGQRIRIDTMDYLVRGVVADAPINSSFQYKAFLPISAMLTNPQIRENDEQWGNSNYITFIKTVPGINPDIIGKKITDVVKKKANDKDASPTTLISLADMHFESEISNSIFKHGNRTTVYIFSFLGFLLLLIACINYVNLTTAKASLRAKEVSIRKITGANRSNLFLQFVTESILISLLSLIVTLFLIQVCLPVFNQLTGRTFTLPLTSVTVWKVLTITLLSALVLNSVYPALLLSSFKPLNVFRGNNVLKVKDTTFRKGLVVLQFTVSVILIAGTIIIYRQMQYVQNTNPGYNRSQVLSFTLPQTIDRANRQSLIQTMKQDLLSQSAIENVTSSNQSIEDIGSMCSECADWPGRDTSYKAKIVQLSADADFLKTMQLQMKEGQWFTNGNEQSKQGFILNETAVRDFKLKEPVVGQPFIFKGDTSQVIGVVKDFYYKSMHEKLGPLVVFNNPLWRNRFVVRVAPKSAAAAISSIQSVWKKYIPESPLEYTFLDDAFNHLYKEDQQSSFLILVFAIIAVVISGMGLFSLAAFEAEQRTKEIGIRKVLGATVAGITALLSKDFIKLVCVSILIASPIAWWAMNKWIQNFAYRTDIGWWIFLLAGFIAIIIALVTVSLQAIKAALANPVKSLRTE
ncbi:MAG: ABC transporter permease, partial [Bacteroidota bacterium]